MRPQDVLAALGEDVTADGFARRWDESMAAMPAGTPAFLQTDQVLDARAACGLGSDLDEVLADVASRVAGDEALCRLAWHCKWHIFDLPDSDELQDLPLLGASLGDRAGVFYLLVGLAMVRRVRAYHRSLGIPESTTRDTCSVVSGLCDVRRRSHGGRPGLQAGRISWLRHYARRPFFRIGRLEYWLKPNPCTPVVYRHRDTGDVIALAPDGERFTPDGYADPAPREAPLGWVSSLNVDDAAVTGHPIAPHGVAVPRQVRLPLPDWERVLELGTSILQVHIPPGGKLTRDAGRDSLRRAVEFFAAHFPHEHPVAFEGTSWAFSNQLESLMPADSNVLAFGRELYLFPVAAPPYSGLSFVFPQEPFDLRTAPRGTRFQAALLDFLAAGNRWRAGGMFLLIDDLEHFGTQRYRSRWPAIESALRSPSPSD